MVGLVLVLTGVTLFRELTREPVSFGPAGPAETDPRCGFNRSWRVCSPSWLSDVAEHAGFDVAKYEPAASSAIEVDTPDGRIYLWAEPLEEFRDSGVDTGLQELAEFGYQPTEIELSDRSRVWKTDEGLAAWNVQDLRVRVEPWELGLTLDTLRALAVSSELLPFGATDPDDDPVIHDGSADCGYGPWAENCPEAEWLRGAMEQHGFRVTGNTGSALVVETPHAEVHLWGSRLEEVYRGEQAGEHERFADEVAAGIYRPVSPHEWALYEGGAGDQFVWLAQGVRIWVAPSSEDPLELATVLDLREATLETPYLSCPDIQRHGPPWNPSAAPGAELTIVADSAGRDEGGRPAVDSFMEVWWNLDVDRYETAVSATDEPAAAGPGPVLRTLARPVDHACETRLTFSVPDVPPGDYPVVILRFSGIGEDAIAGYTFKIEIDGQVIAQFKEVSGLSAEVQVIEHRENNATGKEVIKKLPGQKKWGHITLKRGKTDNKVIWEWHK